MFALILTTAVGTCALFMLTGLILDKAKLTQRGRAGKRLPKAPGPVSFNASAPYRIGRHSRDTRLPDLTPFRWADLNPSKWGVAWADGAYRKTRDWERGGQS